MSWLRESWGKLARLRMMLASVAMVAAAAGLYTHALLGSNGWRSYQQKQSEYRKLQNEVQRMDEENRRLADEIQALRSDPKAIEKEAREQFRYAKPGEVIYILPEVAANSTHPASQSPQK
jgi:cell division protein FtsB